LDSKVSEIFKNFGNYPRKIKLSHEKIN
jgi:hypothetical protein